MSLHLWEAVHDADVRSDPLFLIDPDVVEHEPPSLQRVLLAAAALIGLARTQRVSRRAA